MDRFEPSLGNAFFNQLSYRYIDGGKRYRLGEWPTGPSKVFKEGDSRAPD